jgi:hypothetical protein
MVARTSTMREYHKTVIGALGGDELSFLKKKAVVN